MCKKVLIVCVGNELMGDDGVGIKIGALLQREGYEVINVGTDIFRLISYYKGEKKIVILDAVFSESMPPGQIIHLQDNEIFQKLNGSFRSAHYMGIVDGIKLLKFLCKELENVDVHFIGICVKNIELRENLSKEIENSLTEILKGVRLIVEEIGVRGVGVG